MKPVNPVALVMGMLDWFRPGPDTFVPRPGIAGKPGGIVRVMKWMALSGDFANLWAGKGKLP
jgi:hypothetical protein